MDPPAIVKTIKSYNPSSSSSSQHTMFDVSQNPASLHYKSFPPNHSPKQPPKKTLETETNDDTEISIFDAQKYFSENNDSPKVIILHQQHRPHLDHPSHDTLSSVSSADGYRGRHFRTRSFHATPTASSEASWNSQTGLLANPPGSVGVSMANFSFGNRKKQRNPGAAKKWILGRKCCCTGKKSVQVKEAATLDSDNLGPMMISAENIKNGKFNYRRDSDKAKCVDSSSTSERSNSLTADILEKIQQAKLKAPNPVSLSPENAFPAVVPPRQQRVSAPGGFTFPILNPNSQSTNPALIKGIIGKSPINDVLEEPPRDSLEVFQPPISRIDNVVNPRQHLNPESPMAHDEDMCSDASSDLFEIESFSTQTTSYPMYRRRDSLDEVPTFNARRFAAATGLKLNNDDCGNQLSRRSLDEPPTPSVAATECYAPSEVSIDWSVTTAEGFDKASVSNFSVCASEIGMFRQRVLEESSDTVAAGDGGKKKGNGGGGLLLMSCRQDKAVSVGPQPVKCAPAEGPQAHGGGRPPRGNKPPPPQLGSSHSARLSLAFAA